MAENPWINRLLAYIWVTNGQLLINPEKLSEVIESIRTDGLRDVLANRCMEHRAISPLNDCAAPSECPVCAFLGHVAPDWDRGLNITHPPYQPQPD